MTPTCPPSSADRRSAPAGRRTGRPPTSPSAGRCRTPGATAPGESTRPATSIGWSGALAREHGLPFAAVCSSGTLAVELALRALKVGPGDEVALAAYDYPGNFLAVHAVGARPVLVDVAPDDWNLDLHSLAEALGPAVRAVIVSHLHGGLVPMRELTDLAFARDVAVVEDAAQAPGAMVQGRRAGSWGDVGVLSFGGSKLLTAGRGGALLTGRADVNQRLRLLMHRAGNVLSPLSELQAAVLAPQLDRLDERNARRRQAVGLLAERLRDIPGLSLFRARTDGDPCYYKVGFRFDVERFGLARGASPPPCGRRASPWTRDSAPCTSAGRRIAIAAATR